MNCRHCETKLATGALYCQHCGARQGIPSKIPLIKAQPQMATWVVLGRYFPLQLNLSCIGALIFGGLALVYHLSAGSSLPLYRPFIFFWFVFFLTIPLFIYWGYHQTLPHIRYEFYGDRLLCYEGLWGVKERVLYYQQISEVSLHRNLLQRFYQVGTIKLEFIIPIAGKTQLFISDIPNIEALYQKINQLIREARH